MAHKFTLNPESLKRRFAVYIVIAKGCEDMKLYVGKTGDNREGCNPIISRCGNHFSYNRVHSQVRNKIPNHEFREYTYIFDLFDEYYEDNQRRREAVDRINEMERWFNQEVQEIVAGIDGCELLNPYLGRGGVSRTERSKRSAFRTDEAEKKIMSIVADLQQEIGENAQSDPIKVGSAKKEGKS
jgi:hypothetical protein